MLDQNYALPIQMEVGTTAETITVEANPVQVETTSNQLGAVVQGKTIVDMPLLGRNWIQLQQLQTGVVELPIASAIPSQPTAAKPNRIVT